MNIKKVFARAVLATVPLIASMTLAIPSFATDGSQNTIDSLLAINHDISREQLLEAARGYAQTNGISVNESLNRALQDAKRSAIMTARSSNSGGGGAIPLPISDSKGDIFVAPASTLGYEHGHTGIYHRDGTIIEAPGPGKLSHSIGAEKVLVASGTVLQSVDTPQGNRDSAADYSGQLLDKPYNNVHLLNKIVDAWGYDCAQLVWAAYMKSTKIDITGDPDSGTVLPYDIRDSELTETYKTL